MVLVLGDDMFRDKIMRIAFLLSLTGHLLFLGKSFNLDSNLPIEENRKDLEIVYIRIEKPPLLPKIDVLGEEKKLKPEDRQQTTEDRKEQEHLPEEIVAVEPIKEAEPPKEKIEVIDFAQEAMLRYQDMVKQRIEEVRKYPAFAKRQGIEGIVHLNFRVLSNGLSKDIRIIFTSGSGVLDKEAVATIQRANPFPSIPPKINQDSVAMEVAIVFALN